MKVSQKTMRKIFALAREVGISDSEAFKEGVKKKIGLDSFKNLTLDQASKIIGTLERISYEKRNGR